MDELKQIRDDLYKLKRQSAFIEKCEDLEELEKINKLIAELKRQYALAYKKIVEERMIKNDEHKRK